MLKVVTGYSFLLKAPYLGNKKRICDASYIVLLYIIPQFYVFYFIFDIEVLSVQFCL